MPIRPLLLKGHTRPLTFVKFNRDSDLLFTCAKDHLPTVWYADSGERLGTYNGHAGSVYACDISFHSTRLITASADRTVKMWDVRTGTELHSFDHEAGVRGVAFAEGDNLFVSVQDNTFSKQSGLHIYDVKQMMSTQFDEVLTSGNEQRQPLRLTRKGDADENSSSSNASTDDTATEGTSSTSSAIRSSSTDADAKEPIKPTRIMCIEGSRDKMIAALWGPLNETIISAGEDGVVRVWDVETGAVKLEARDHRKQINSLSFSKDHTMFITASSDFTARVYDTRSLQLLRTITSDRPLNAAALSPLFNHAIVGGGQEAMNVTVTSAKVGHFEIDFYHLVYGDFLGSVKGHFGPVNAVAFNSNGKAFASGAEDGYIRLHHFDKQYLQWKDPQV